MRKLARGTVPTTIMVIEPAWNTVPVVVPIARVRHRLELGLLGIQSRGLVIRVGDIELIVLQTHLSECLAKCVFRLGQVGILLQDDSEVCVRR